MERAAQNMPGAGELASRAELTAVLQNAIAGLPDSLRATVVLRFEEGLSFASIGAAIGASESTAHDRLGRALERLRAVLAGAGMGTLAGAPGSLEDTLMAWGERAPIPEIPAGVLKGLSDSWSSGGVAASSHGSSIHGLVVDRGAWLSRPWVMFAGAGAALTATVLSGVLMAQGGAGAIETPEQRGSDQIGSEQIGSEQMALDQAVFVQGQKAPEARGAGPVELAAAVGARAPAADPSAQDGGSGPGPYVLAGKVVDQGGVGVSAATVRVSTVERGGKHARWSSTVAANEDGSFELTVPFDGALAGAADAELILDAGHLGYLHLGKSRVRARPGARDSVNLGISLPSGERAGDFTLDLIVRGPGGKPLPGTLVALSHVTPRDGATVGPGVPFPQWSSTEKWLRLDDGSGQTDADGRLRISGQRLGAKSLWVEPPGAFAPARQSLSVLAGGVQAYDVTVAAGEALRGHVAWAEGGEMEAEELANLQFSAVLEPNRWRTVAVREDGTFLVEGLAKGALTLRVGPNWGWPRSLGDPPSRARLEVEAGGPALELRMKRRSDTRDVGVHDGELHFDAVDASTGEAVAVSPADHFAWRLWDLPKGDMDLDLFPNLLHAPTVQRMLGPGGERFGVHKDGLDAGPYMIQVSTQEHGFGVIGPVVLGVGEVRSGLEVKIGAPGTVEVTVVDGEGAPVEGAWVFVTGAGPYSDSVVDSVDKRFRDVDGKGTFLQSGGRRTDARGRAALGGLPHGLRCTVGAVHPAYRPGRSKSLGITAAGAVAVTVAVAK